MVETFEKQENTCIAKDRLSELSDKILIHIISFLPIEDAVDTIFLRRFGNLWTLLPTLKFDRCSPKFINNVMKFHKSPTIDRLEFEGDWMAYPDMQENLTNWIGLAFKKKPKVVDIRGGYRMNDILEEFNRFIFTSQSIVTLKISNMSLNLPRQVNMSSLTTLKLHFVKIIEDDMKLLELGCPCLQELIFCNPFIMKFHFTASNIETLKLYECSRLRHKTFYSLDCPKVKFMYMKQVCLDNLELIDVSSVTHVRIINPSYDLEIHNFELLYKKFKNAKVFHLEDHDGFAMFLGSKVCMQLEQCGNEIPTFQQNDLSLLAPKSGYHKSCLLGICRLLRSSRLLEELILHVDMDLFCDCNMLIQELASPCVMRNLKTVTILDFEKPCKTLVQLIEFLLKSALVLDKLVIVCNKDKLNSTKGFEFVLELLSFPRASYNAKVVIA